MRKPAGLLVALFVAFSALASPGQAHQLLFSDNHTAWGTFGSPTSPAALAVSAGMCNLPGTCDFRSGTGMLDPLVFYPSPHNQKVTLTSGLGFDSFGIVFAQGGDIRFTTQHSFSMNGGIAPSNFFMVNYADGGERKLDPATVSSIEVILASFTFQQVSDEKWKAIGRDGKPPQL